ncbi:glycosyl hydrolase [Actinoplanes sp. NPDC049802]|uniref:glycoside hydrolase family 26 protein n=1 Tax=Actinoplanes sp. NPDC049802 TaxID=3154742 RepID=UPI0033C32A0E
MSSGHREGEQGLTRRGLLGLGALGAASAAGVYGMWKAASRETTHTVSGTPSATGPVEPAPPSATPSPFAAVADPAKLGGVVPFTPGKALLGSYLGLTGMSYPEAVRYRRKQLGRDHRIVHVFYAWPDQLPTSIEGMPKKAIPMVSWRGPKYDKILSGDSDELIATAARRLKQLDRPTLLRWGWEMNGRWYEWGGFQNKRDPEGFIKCFRHLREIFDDQGADNVSWVWSPNWRSSPDEHWNRMEAYYPGDKFVDWVGVSGYDFDREKPPTLFDPIYQKYASRKPILITEVGSKDYGGTSKADWITEFSEYVAQRPAIGGSVWFDTDTHPNYPERWRFDTDPRSTAAYKAMATSPRFSA